MNSRTVKEANPALLAGKKQDPSVGVDAKQKLVTTLVESIFMNVKHSEDGPDRFEIDPRTNTSDIDDLMRILSNERKVIRKRELQERADLEKAARDRHEH